LAYIILYREYGVIWKAHTFIFLFPGDEKLLEVIEDEECKLPLNYIKVLHCEERINFGHVVSESTPN